MATNAVNLPTQVAIPGYSFSRPTHNCYEYNFRSVKSQALAQAIHTRARTRMVRPMRVRKPQLMR